MEESRYLLPRSILHVAYDVYAVIESEEAISYILDNNLKIIEQHPDYGVFLVPQSIKELTDINLSEDFYFTDDELEEAIEQVIDNVYIVGDKEKIIMFKMMFA